MLIWNRPWLCRECYNCDCSLAIELRAPGCKPCAPGETPVGDFATYLKSVEARQAVPTAVYRASCCPTLAFCSLQFRLGPRCLWVCLGHQWVRLVERMLRSGCRCKAVHWASWASSTLIDAHRCTPMHTDAHRCTPMHTDAHDTLGRAYTACAAGDAPGRRTVSPVWVAGAARRSRRAPVDAVGEQARGC
jgi:hypothetical protein